MPDELSSGKQPLFVTDRLDAIFAPWNRTDTPGLIVGVSYREQAIYRRAFGMASLESSTANTLATKMRIGSTSKHFTAILALLLAEEGKLDLDVPVARYVPEVEGVMAESTIRQLLQHRGGSRCHIDIGYICHGMATAPSGYPLRILSRCQSRNFAPGEAMIYNNGGYHLTSLAIERVGGATFETQLKDRLFTPLGMTASESIRSDYVITPGLATMHIPLPGGGWRRGLFPSEELLGEGAIVSTIDDMLRWTTHLRQRSHFGSPESWHALVEQSPLPDGLRANYALGLMLGSYRGLRTLHHAGNVIGGGSQMLTLPEHDLDIVILVNGARGANPSRLAEDVVDIVLEDVVGPRAPTIPVADMSNWLGNWWSAETGMIYSLTDDDGVLKLAMGGQAGMALEPSGEGCIVSPAHSLGEIIFKPVHDDLGQGLIVLFGGSAARYIRLNPDDVDTGAFLADAAGSYIEVDGLCSAQIGRDETGIFMHIQDEVGGLSSELTPLAPDVAGLQPAAAADRSWYAVSLIRQARQVSGFRLNTARTRNLIFRRKP